ncbi:MAG: hypothetical protein ACR2I2_11265 [Bryobacteraceae bacterium]
MGLHHIDREHPEYVANKAVWKRYRDLYAGGEQFRTNASEYLVRRSKEPGDVYFERLNRVFYENYIGSIIDWFTATLTRREPVIHFDGLTDVTGTFYDLLIQNCDLKGTTLTQFFKAQMSQTLVYGKSYLVVDFPRVANAIVNRADEDASGRSRAYLVDYSPEDVINWSYDTSGQLEWVVIRTSCLRQESVQDDSWNRETRWIYYDKQNFEIYTQATRTSGQAAGIELTAEGQHGFALQNRVPVFEIHVSDNLWLMNKGALLQLEHFNKSNALSWALTMGLFATPVIYSEREWNQIVGESYYIQLAPEDRFAWAEPEGHTYQIASDNLVRLKEEIYRVCYLISQAGGSAGHVLQSGLSKQRDFGATQEILRSYGDTVKDTIRVTLEAIAVARQDNLTVDVSGLDEFDIGDFSAELSDAKGLLDLGIQSQTLKRQLFKSIALKYFCDSRQEIKNRIAAEIDASFDQQIPS